MIYYDFRLLIFLGTTRIYQDLLGFTRIYLDLLGFARISDARKTMRTERTRDLPRESEKGENREVVKG